MKKIVIGSDKSGFFLEEAVKVHLAEAGYEVEDCGTKNVDEPMPYFQVAPIPVSYTHLDVYKRQSMRFRTAAGL